MFWKRQIVLFNFACLIFYPVNSLEDVRSNVFLEIQQKPEAPRQRERPISVESSLVAVSISVTDPMNRLITGLEKENFQIFEDGVEQKILNFSGEDTPVAIGIVLDNSGSMGEKLGKSREAVTQFLKTANPEDQFFLVRFDDQPWLPVTYTKDYREIQSSLLSTTSHGRTALLDAVYMAVNYSRQVKDMRKALLVISDGGDNHSRYTENEVKAFVKESDVQIYAIGIFEPIGSRGRTPEELAGPSLMTNIAESTGGRQFIVENLSDLPDIAQKVSLELRNQYVLHYRPINGAKDGRYRKIKVKMNLPKGLPPLKANYRPGYYAPQQ